jgi:hypothetical protein
MSKDTVKFWSIPVIASLFGGGIAWISSAPLWVIIVAAIGSPAIIALLFIMFVINEMLKGI